MKNEEQEKISCHVCQKMIPKAAALHAEGQDYVLHFCDTSCLDHWRQEHMDEVKVRNPGPGK
ncbi:MAG: hypothetical protein A2Y56_09045 [Candidatus Aminicenantes bacterium RBG_13_63_10]|nr:MAG: hypothetical protein A2Y56_09045 [Candidatus Aminicenantes bacterium RBG_13_63_10]